MAYTALRLVIKSYYLSQVVSRGLQVVSGEQISDGLDLLNDLLDVKGSDLRLIPYFTRATFNLVQGQELYFIPNLLQIDALTLNDGVNRYLMIEQSRRDYFATSRVDNIQSLPMTFRQERVLGGTNLYFYFFPNKVYTINYSGKFCFTDVALTTDLSLTYDLYYIEYLRCALAEYICCDYGATFPDEAKIKYAEIRKKLMDISPMDLTIRKRSYFNNGFGWDWQTINLTEGYIPG